jgi:membrane protein DedA with SNARE-associated domain
MEWFNKLLADAITVLNQGNLAALSTLFFVTVLTEIGVPFPFILDTTLFLSSYQNGPSMHVLNALLIIFMGRLSGSAVIYWSSRLLGDALVNWLAKRFKTIKSNLHRIESRISGEAPFAVALPRVTGLMTITSLAAGAICLRYHQFVLGVMLSSIIFDGALIILGFIMSSGFHYLGFTPSLWQIALTLILFILLVWAIRFIIVRRRAKLRSEDKDSIV